MMWNGGMLFCRGGFGVLCVIGLLNLGLPFTGNAAEVCTEKAEFVSVMTSCSINKKQIPLYQEQVKTLGKIIKEKDKIIAKLEEERAAFIDYKQSADNLRDTLLEDRERQEKVEANLREQLANRPTDWALIAEVAATTLAARWGGGHVWRIGKKVMGR